MSWLLFLFLTVSSFNLIHCNLYGAQIRKYFQDIYAPLNEGRSLSRRNVPTFAGSGVFQEPSSRDLDVGFAVGVKDVGEASDVLINNHSTKLYSPPSPEHSGSPAYIVQDPSSYKEVNIGVFVDPKSGVRYYAPGFVPSNGKANVYEFTPEKYTIPVVPGVGPIYPITPNQQYPIQQPHPSYPVTPQTPNYINRYPIASPNINTWPYSYQTMPNAVPLAPNPFSEPIPGQNYFNQPLSLFQQQQAINPYQNYLQQPPEISFSSIPYVPKLSQFPPPQIPETAYQPPLANNVYDERLYPSGYPGRLSRLETAYRSPLTSIYDEGAYPGSYPEQFAVPELVYRPPLRTNLYDEGLYPGSYSGRFPRSHGRHSQGNYFRYKYPLNNLQNVFQVQEVVPRGSSGNIAQPVIVRQEPQAPEIIYDQQGAPLMSAQPYGERQVGAFKLRNDHGYQVTMNVPPMPGDGPADGVLVMEMKANLYRPIS